MPFPTVLCTETHLGYRATPFPEADLFLDQYRDTDATDHFRRFSWPPCPARAHLVVGNSHTGQLVPARCDRLICPSCITPRALAVAEAIALARPTHLVTLTLVGNGWWATKERMKRFRENLRRRRVKCEYAYHVEQNPDGAGRHAHLWWWGDEPEIALLRTAASRTGMGHVAHCEVLDPAVTPPAAFRYGLKEILRERPDAADELWPRAVTYLESNGGRLVHGTSRFWRADGVVLSGRIAALAEVRRRRPGYGDWHLLPAG